MIAFFSRTTKISFIAALTVLLGACAGRAPNIKIPLVEPKPLILHIHPKVALVLGAGGARGFAHAGAVKVLENAGVPIDLIVGASVGSFYGALLADSGSANTAGKIMLSATFWDVADLSNMPSIKGAMQGYRYQKFLLKNMHARWFDQLKIPLIVVTTDLKTGKAFIISSGPIAPAAEASAAIPGAVKPAHLYGRTLVDGGMTDPIPVDIALQYHPKVIIAINVAQQLNKKMPWTAFGIFNRGFKIAWLKLCALSEHKATVIIRPNVGNIGTFEISKKYQLFHEGERAAYQELPKILKILRENHIPLRKQPGGNNRLGT